MSMAFDNQLWCTGVLALYAAYLFCMLSRIPVDTGRTNLINMQDPTTEQLMLLEDVHLVDGSEIYPSKLLLSGVAFPLVKSKEGFTIVAASVMGNGRIAVSSHEGIVNRFATNDDSALIIRNIFKWMTIKKTSPKVGIIDTGYTALADNLKNAGYTVMQITPDQLQTVDAVFTSVYTEYTDEDLNKFENFIQAGGGMLAAGHNWYYQYPWVNYILFNCGITISTDGGGGYQMYKVKLPSPSTSVSNITEGVDTINLNGALPSVLCAFGLTSFGLVADQRGVIIAGSHHAAGRVVHVGHGRLLDDTGTEITILINNIATWLTRRNATSKVVGFLAQGHDGLQAKLRDIGLESQATDIDDDFSRFTALFTDCYTQYTQEQVKKIYTFVTSGGGLLTAGHNWYYKTKWASDIVLPAGIMISTDYGSSGEYVVQHYDVLKQDLLNATLAMKAVYQYSSGSATLSLPEQQMACETIRVASNLLPYGTEPFDSEGQKYLDQVQTVIPTASLRIDVRQNPMQAIYIYISNGFAIKRPPAKIFAHPAAATFPGTVPPQLQPISKTVSINGTFKELPSYFKSDSNAVRRSTGLYAAPGETINVVLPAEYAGRGITILIGAHTDNLYKQEELGRYPYIFRTFELNEENSDAANAFGGLIYVTVPPGSTFGTIPITISGAYECPMYEHGVTTEEQWHTSLINHPVPFCELISDKKIILTVPTSEALAKVTHPGDLMKIYEESVDCMAVLSGISTDRAREERFVLDVQITHGSFHAGYPIMGHLYSTSYMLDLPILRVEGLWGPLHELGHQLQSDGWNPDGSGEATNNIFSVYCSEIVLKIPRSSAHSELSAEKRIETIEAYIAGGRDYKADWNVWTALETYLQLQEAFGWLLFRDMLKIYNAPMPDRPRSNTDILDMWMILSSELTGYNLGPFYLGWGWPVTEKALDKISSLPFWPANPMPSSMIAFKTKQQSTKKKQPNYWLHKACKACKNVARGPARCCCGKHKE